MSTTRPTWALTICALIAIILAAPPAGAQSRIEDLHWIDQSGTYVLADSKGSIRIGTGMALLLGDQARRAEYLSEGVESPALEAILYDIDNEVSVYFEYYPTGYIKDEDWKTVDAAALMREMVAGTEAANAERAQRGKLPLKIAGWETEPYYDARRNIIGLAIAVDSSRERSINSSIMKLGRHGYERITWVGSADQYGWSDRLLETVVENHSFDRGYRYKDYQAGDAEADFGVAGLVSAVALSKSPRAGWAIMKLLRRFWYLIAGGLALLFGAGRAASSDR